ncbi:MAG: NAD-dependent epimerase/dehydratase family protein [Planctomycetota bacterium]|nr:MAG: NAD-dependent epimerase/dehydratase family protein [Planctomycetota bacterium]
MKNILVTGAVGQIGSELTMALREKYGAQNVVATGRKTEPSARLRDSGPFYFIDVTKHRTVREVVEKHNIDTIYHMAAILSGTGEKNPGLCWNVNMKGMIIALEIARELEMARVILPSSIAVFGEGCPQDLTPQETVLRPKTVYGITKVAGELICDYYVDRYGLDVRGLRYPGIISAETMPGGGTTDYAVEIFYEAIRVKKYTSFIGPETSLPMMYMPDCLKATIDIAEAPFSKLEHHSDFNVSGFSINPAELAAEIKKHIPEFEISYETDFRQAIAESWPNSIDDSAAREEWGWEPAYDLAAMTEDMLEKLQARFAEGTLYGESNDPK